MKLTNSIKNVPDRLHSQAAYQSSVRTLVQLLAPIAPVVASELFERLPKTSTSVKADDFSDVFSAGWPVPVMQHVLPQTVSLVVQVSDAMAALFLFFFIYFLFLFFFS